MAEKPTYEELEQRVKALEKALAHGRGQKETLFDPRLEDSLLHPDWPEAKWNISGLFAHRRLVHLLVNMMKTWEIGHALEAFHGCPDLIWNGGRVNTNTPKFPDSADYIKFLNDNGTGAFLTFSNLVLEKEHLSDPDSNRLLECLDETSGLNGVIVATDLMADYIREKKPGLKQILSVTRSFIDNPEGNVDWYRQMQQRFDRVVVHTDHIFDLDLLDKLDRSKAEILITEECSYKCPNRQHHQTLNSRYNLTRSDEVFEELKKIRKTMCGGGAGVLSKKKNIRQVRTCFLKHEEVKAIYDLGFRHFKISGRRKPPYGLAWNVINFVYNPTMAHAFSRAIYMTMHQGIKRDFANLAKKKGLMPARA